MSAFLVAVTASALVAVGTPATADEVPVFNGFGRGMTAERAIERAIDDAENSASSEGLFNCELIAEPIVWPPGTWAVGDVSYTASVDMICV
ncbi:hypothetical protein DPM19_01375 [Actinomadura craniellae]|uniref:Uncharacterized protein n=1 Tax=Actinomadura craniellae TaxID=2231787 RepID=A0A365HCL2_9ACTN|nr:hypothetical protein [Actinomadura craniellae]RAY16845.1 hypothetical protein DPM19_01375 [Actinomadura craniellae]